MANKGHVPNPTGKGGFVDNPQNRSDGRWSKENSFSYWYNFFKRLTVKEFKEYEQKKPDDERSVAESLAYARIVNARRDLREFQEVADRTEGRPTQRVEQDITGGLFNTEKLQIEVIDEAATEQKTKDSS